MVAGAAGRGRSRFVGWETDWGRALAPVPAPAEPIVAKPVPVSLLPEFTIAGGLAARPETVARTLFNPTRRPAPPVVAEAPKPRMQRGQFALTGTLVVDGKSTAFLREVAGGKARRVLQGETINGLVVAEVKPDRVRLALGDESEELMLKVQTNPRPTASRSAPRRRPAPARGGRRAGAGQRTARAAARGSDRAAGAPRRSRPATAPACSRGAGAASEAAAAAASRRPHGTCRRAGARRAPARTRQLGTTAWTSGTGSARRPAANDAPRCRPRISDASVRATPSHAHGQSNNDQTAARSFRARVRCAAARARRLRDAGPGVDAGPAMRARSCRIRDAAQRLAGAAGGPPRRGRRRPGGRQGDASSRAPACS